MTDFKKLVNAKKNKMRTENTFGVHFIVRMNKAKNGKAPIYARITVNQKRCELALKRLISSADWNSSKGLAKPKTDELRRLNSYLEQVRGPRCRALP